MICTFNNMCKCPICKLYVNNFYKYSILSELFNKYIFYKNKFIFIYVF